MRFNKENYTIYIIILIFIYWIIKFSYQFSFSSPNYFMRIELEFGPLPWIFFILILVALVSIIIDYRFNWVVISLPFFWFLFFPFKIIGSEFFRGQLLMFVQIIIRGGNPFFTPILPTLIALLIIFYLFFKNLRNIENKKYEIISGLIILFFLLLFII